MKNISKDLFITKEQELIKDFMKLGFTREIAEQQVKECLEIENQRTRLNRLKENNDPKYYMESLGASKEDAVEWAGIVEQEEEKRRGKKDINNPKTRVQILEEIYNSGKPLQAKHDNINYLRVALNRAAKKLTKKLNVPITVEVSKIDKETVSIICYRKKY